MMKNSMVESVTITLGLVLSAGVSARAETYFEDFATGNHLDPATNYGFTQIVGGDSHVRFGMDIDPLGLALFGGGTSPTEKITLKDENKKTTDEVLFENWQRYAGLLK